MAVYLSLIFQQLISSGTHIIAKVVVRDIDPLTLTMLRSALAALVLVAFMAVRGRRFSFAREDRRTIVLLSILAIPVNQFLFLCAMKYTTPANASLLYGATPALVLILSAARGSEVITGRKVSGIILAFSGILLVVFERGVDLRSSYTFGNILLLLAVIAWAFYTVLGRPMIIKYGAFTTSAATMILGTLFYLPIGIYPTTVFPYSTLRFAHWGGIIYLGLGTSVFAYFLWYYALARIEASKVAVFSNLQPVMTTVLAAVLLGFQITPVFVVGGLLALGGVIITQRA